MQTSTSIKRLFAAVMAVVMMLTAIPFVTAADEAKETVNFGTYNGAPIKWDVLETKDNGDLVLISSDVVFSSKYLNTSAVPNYADSLIHSTLNGSFYEDSFTAAEKALIKDSTVEYKTKTTTASITAKVIIPNTAMVTTYTLGAASEKYWLADGQGTAAGKAAKVVATTGSITNNGVATAAGVRPMITIAAVTSGKFEAADGVTFTVADAAVETYTSIADVAFKVVIDTENYTADELVVKLGDTVLTAANGVYTIPAGSTETVTVSGVVALPADFTAYDAAKASAEEVDRDLYTDDTLAALDKALATDVSACTKLNQADVDAAAQAILAAIEALVYKPADVAALEEAFAKLDVINKNEKVQVTTGGYTVEIYALDATDPVTGKQYGSVILLAKKDYKDYVKYTADKQADVDAAVKAINEIIDRIPHKQADNGKWIEAYNKCINTDATKFANADEIKAEAEVLKAENDFSDTTGMDIDKYQQAIEDATAELTALYESREKIKADYTALDEAITLAKTYIRDNYYYEEEMAGAEKAWTEFADALKAAEELDRELNSTIDEQVTIDARKDALIRTMGELEPFIRLTEWQKFVKDVKDFFKEIEDFFGMVSGILTFVGGIIKSLINGEIEFNVAVYDILDMIGDDDITAAVEKIIPRPEPEA